MVTDAGRDIPGSREATVVPCHQLPDEALREFPASEEFEDRAPERIARCSLSQRH